MKKINLTKEKINKIGKVLNELIRHMLSLIEIEDKINEEVKKRLEAQKRIAS